MNRYGNNSSRCFVDNFFTVISTSDNLTAEIFCQYFYVRKSNIIGNNSKRPANISKLSTIFEKLDNEEKFPTGPIKSPNPGPTFPKQVSGAVSVVIISKFSKEINNTDAKNINA